MAHQDGQDLQEILDDRFSGIKDLLGAVLGDASLADRRAMQVRSAYPLLAGIVDRAAACNLIPADLVEAAMPHPLTLQALHSIVHDQEFNGLEPCDERDAECYQEWSRRALELILGFESGDDANRERVNECISEVDPVFLALVVRQSRAGEVKVDEDLVVDALVCESSYKRIVDFALKNFWVSMPFTLGTR